MKYAAHWDYRGGGYNFDSSDNLQELISGMQEDFISDETIIAVYVGEAGPDGLLHAEFDPIWSKTRS